MIHPKPAPEEMVDMVAENNGEFERSLCLRPKAKGMFAAVGRLAPVKSNSTLQMPNDDEWR